MNGCCKVAERTNTRAGASVIVADVTEVAGATVKGVIADVLVVDVLFVPLVVLALAVVFRAGTVVGVLDGILLSIKRIMTDKK
ncbi:hypothetical protein FVA96_24495 [Escherichia coli]|nr:hypothetical protein [Escherichia coli]